MYQVILRFWLELLGFDLGFVMQRCFDDLRKEKAYVRFALKLVNVTRNKYNNIEMTTSAISSGARTGDVRERAFVESALRAAK
ncbi:hypothetical protein SERLA73DRAFT_181265 [Serpula lacrymans var. lacrymans S7.3]|uniref:Uncharacterized protein n=2 Tax=Serpula lacrymans var. lacrymans TaxID=341189 RepID=F8PXR8_SERL3|nr:uncharacterized protein SERLADRAFT_467341 [Serpula lacrymans var. lacrymans S7.9]EGN98681.1 hypothetical protein SERLA73DRAFT_181265 [Serpula lacrymans var. lacrymans S7.3]EGO24285.1 hypothetical protein SERLADRAFT_467341 [Serpula lacrymans var. lacrymans S7.9]